MTGASGSLALSRTASKQRTDSNFYNEGNRCSAQICKKSRYRIDSGQLCVGAALLIWRFLPSNGKTEAVIYAGGEVYRRVTLDKSADMTITPDTDPKVVIKIKDRLSGSKTRTAAINCA